LIDSDVFDISMTKTLIESDVLDVRLTGAVCIESDVLDAGLAGECAIKATGEFERLSSSATYRFTG